MPSDNLYTIELKCVLADSGQGGATNPETAVTQNQGNDTGVSQKKTEANEKSGASIAKSLALQYAKKAVAEAAANYGDITGDYNTGANLSAMMSLGMTAASIAVNPVIGSIAAVWQVGSAAYSEISAIKKSERRAAFMRQRVGYNRKS